MPDEKDQSKAAGGHARAAALTVEERKAIARRAAAARWSGDLGIAEFEGEFNLGEISISCAVLDDGSRMSRRQLSCVPWQEHVPQRPELAFYPPSTNYRSFCRQKF